MDSVFYYCLVSSTVISTIKAWRRLWPAGIVGLVLLYYIDTTLIDLGAFSYRTDNTIFYTLFNIPAFYVFSAFPAAVLLVYYFPKSHLWKLPYVLFTAGLFLGMERIMDWLGYFHSKQWSSTIAYFLDVGGFIVVIWVSEWLLDLKGNSRI